MTSSYGDGSWQLSVSVIEQNVDRTLRVKGDLHIGGLMLKIVDGLDVTTDWSDYALWWPAKSLWLLRTRSTLDQYGVQADAHLEFTRMHKSIQVLLPDLQVYETLVNFSANVFTVVIKICKELGIRHPEEMSLSRKLEPEELKRNRGASATRRSRSSSLRPPSTPGTASQYMSLGSLLDNGRGSCSTIHSPGRCTPSRFTSRESLLRTSSVPRSPYASGLRTPYSPSTVPFNANGMLSPNSVNSLFFHSATDCNSPFVNSPYISTSQAFQLLYRPTNLQEKARINAGWYDSSRSLMEQGLTENSIVLLKFKFFAFYDLNPKFDAVRINEIYEQAKWSILSEEINCSLDEMFLFAALQLQVQIQSHFSEHSPEGTTNGRCSAYSSEAGNGRCSFYSQSSATNGQSTYSPSIGGASSGYCSTFSPGGATNGRCSVREETAEDQIDAALNELQKALESAVDGPVDGPVDILDATNTSQLPVSTASRTDVTHVPLLADTLRYFKPKKGLWWRSYRKYYFVFKDVTLSMYRTATSKEHLSSASLKGCDVSADVSVSASRYIIKLFLPSSAGQTMSEVWLRTETEDQYARWMAAIKLASKGRTMADTAAYETEQRTIVSLLQLQRCNQTTSPSPVTASPPDNGGTPFSLPATPGLTPGLAAGSQLSILPPDFIAPRFLHKLRSKHMVQRILDAHNNVCNMSLTDAKLKYIQAWQSLTEYGLTYFIVKFKGSRKEDLLGVAYNQLVRLDMQTGDTLRTWRFPNMKSWSVNWDIRQVNVSFEEEDLAFQCLTADCKVVHEFIGGYIFLSMRSADRSQTLNEELFHKLTGGWV